MLTPEDFVNRLEQDTSFESQRAFILSNLGSVTDETVQAIKELANKLRQINLELSRQIRDLLFFIADQTGMPMHRAMALMVQGNIESYENKAQTAVISYDEAREWALKAGNEVEAARSQVGKIWALILCSKWTDAIKTAEQIKDVLINNGQLYSAAGAMANEATAYSNLGDKRKAVELYDQAIKILEQLDTRPAHTLRSTHIYNSALLLFEEHRYTDCLERAEIAVQLSQSLGNTIDVATAQQLIAICFYYQGHFNKALRLLLDIVPVFVKNKAKYWEMSSKKVLQACYTELGQLKKAVELNRELLGYYDSQGLSFTEVAGEAALNLGRALRLLGIYDEAEIMLLQGRQVFESLQKPVLVAICNFDLAEIKFIERHLVTAREIGLTALQTFREQNIQVFCGMVQLLLARIALVNQEVDEAENLAFEALNAFQAQHQSLYIYNAQILLAEITKAKLMQQEQASPYQTDIQTLAFYKQALQTLEQMRGNIAAESRATFLKDKSKVYESLVEIYLKLDQPLEAFQIVEKAKSRVLNELISNNLDIRVKVRDEKTRPLVEEYERLRTEYNKYCFKLNLVQNVVDSNAEKVLAASEQSQIQQLKQDCEQQLIEITEHLHILNADYAEDFLLENSIETKFDNSLLPVDSVVVEYYFVHDQIVAFVITRDKIEAVQNLVSLSALNRAFGLLRFNLSSVAGDGTITTSSTTKTTFLIKQLYQMLIEPLEELISAFRNLIIVPYSSLHYLPFHALMDKQNRYLLQKFEEISYLPSSGLWRFCRERAEKLRRENGSLTALVMSYSNHGALPFTKTESQILVKLMASNPKYIYHYFEEKEATLAGFQQHAANHSLIHLATHAHFRQDAPLFSSLSLADGELTAQDIFNMELKASLLTLSACETGLGAVSGGDELLGLSRACLYAGVSSMALSLWQVNDQAGAKLMEVFYSRLLAGESKAAALRHAQLALIEEPDFQHPFNWAAFILVGDPSNL